jgi:hypothetical protein
MSKSFAVKTNDMLVVVYLSSLIRSVLALHDLVNNKLENRAREQKVRPPTSCLTSWHLQGKRRVWRYRHHF